MADKLTEYARQRIPEILKTLPAEERLKGLSAEEVVHALPAETLRELVRLAKANGQFAEPDAADNPPRE